MRTLNQMLCSVGDPVSMYELRDTEGHHIAFCNWRFKDAQFEVRSSDALRVAINLGGTFTGTHEGAGNHMRITSSPGAMALFAPNSSWETAGLGEIGIFEAYFSAKDMGYSNLGTDSPPPVRIESDILRQAMIKMFVATVGRDRTAIQFASIMLRHAAWRAFSDNNIKKTERLKRGGLPPMTRLKIESMINHPDHSIIPSVENLAITAGLSTNHFIRSWKEETGRTPYQYISFRRAQRALGLLCKTDNSVVQIAYHLGFSSPSHFISAFRQKFGVTPASYRSTILQQGGPIDSLPAPHLN